MSLPSQNLLAIALATFLASATTAASPPHKVAVAGIVKHVKHVGSGKTCSKAELKTFQSCYEWAEITAKYTPSKTHTPASKCKCCEMSCEVPRCKLLKSTPLCKGDPRANARAIIQEGNDMQKQADEMNGGTASSPVPHRTPGAPCEDDNPGVSQSPCPYPCARQPARHRTHLWIRPCVQV